ncbi:hypothetical protein B0H15DRAFT_798842 [Mycena belliarum]|uniref:Uncharacterized protein n=1 Tax=Mycena belliarum TaxID=1033014 RepID=A0AAD6U9L7_9AGAR|nr:hypothetical protein B0H15DRAFT_798842 [Mycena belliae]
MWLFNLWWIIFVLCLVSVLEMSSPSSLASSSSLPQRNDQQIRLARHCANAESRGLPGYVSEEYGVESEDTCSARTQCRRCAPSEPPKPQCFDLIRCLSPLNGARDRVVWCSRRRYAARRRLAIAIASEESVVEVCRGPKVRKPRAPVAHGAQVGRGLWCYSSCVALVCGGAGVGRESEIGAGGWFRGCCGLRGGRVGGHRDRLRGSRGHGWYLLWVCEERRSGDRVELSRHCVAGLGNRGCSFGKYGQCRVVGVVVVVSVTLCHSQSTMGAHNVTARSRASTTTRGFAGDSARAAQGGVGRGAGRWVARSRGLSGNASGQRATRAGLRFPRIQQLGLDLAIWACSSSESCASGRICGLCGAKGSRAGWRRAGASCGLRAGHALQRPALKRKRYEWGGTRTKSAGLGAASGADERRTGGVVGWRGGRRDSEVCLNRRPNRRAVARRARPKTQRVRSVFGRCIVLRWWRLGGRPMNLKERLARVHRGDVGVVEAHAAGGVPPEGDALRVDAEGCDDLGAGGRVLAQELQSRKQRSNWWTLPRSWLQPRTSNSLTPALYSAGTRQLEAVDIEQAERSQLRLHLSRFQSFKLKRSSSSSSQVRTQMLQCAAELPTDASKLDIAAPGLPLHVPRPSSSPPRAPPPSAFLPRPRFYARRPASSSRWLCPLGAASPPALRAGGLAASHRRRTTLLANAPMTPSTDDAALLAVVQPRPRAALAAPPANPRTGVRARLRFLMGRPEAPLDGSAGRTHPPRRPPRRSLLVRADVLRSRRRHGPPGCRRRREHRIVCAHAQWAVHGADTNKEKDLVPAIAMNEGENTGMRPAEHLHAGAATLPGLAHPLHARDRVLPQRWLLARVCLGCTLDAQAALTCAREEPHDGCCENIFRQRRGQGGRGHGADPQMSVGPHTTPSGASVGTGCTRPRWAAARAFRSLPPVLACLTGPTAVHPRGAPRASVHASVANDNRARVQRLARRGAPTRAWTASGAGWSQRACAALCYDGDGPGPGHLAIK